MKSAIITGVAGFIGSHLAEKLLSNGWQIIGIDNFDNFYDKEIKEKNLIALKKSAAFIFLENNICDDETWKKIHQNIDVIFHLAAKAGVLPSLKQPELYIEYNILGTQKILNFMKENQCKKLIFASSSSVYGNNNKTPFAETDVVDRTISPYAATKKACETLIYTNHYLYGISAVCLRFFTVIGPRQRPDLAVHKFINKISNNEEIEMYGDGDSARDYTYIDDIIEGVVNAARFIEQDVVPKYEIVNLGNSQPIPLKQMIETIFHVMSKEVQYKKVEMKKGDVDITFADISKAKTLLNYQPKVKFEDGVRKFYDWYKEQTVN